MTVPSIDNLTQVMETDPHCPPVPIVGCINHKDGCRCSIEVTTAVPERKTLSKLF